MSINHVMLVGWLGSVPELRTTATGKSVCKLNVATTWWSSEKKEKETDWHRVVAWDKTAERCHESLDKGSQVVVEGRLVYNSWKAPDGSNRTSSEVVARRVVFVRDPKTASRGPQSEVPF